MSKRDLETRVVHGARALEQGPIATPIVQTSSFTFRSSAELRRYLEGDADLYFYSAYGNPTLRELEESLAGLEEAQAGVVFASGTAAIATTLLSLVKAGDEVLASGSLYGGSVKLVRDVLPRMAIAGRLVPLADLARLDAVIGPKSRVLLVETPTNPTLDIVDIAAVASAAHARGLVVVVDNTFATPYLQRPLTLGADLVVHSLTKAIAGHHDVIGGALLGSRELVDRARAMLRALGGSLDPHAAFLVSRGLRTLHLRVQRQCENALALAQRLERHPGIERVVYPGLPGHPGHAIARRQMSAFGSIVTLVLAGGLAAAERFYDRVSLVVRAASLGGLETLVSLPVYTSHRGYTDEQLREAGVAPGMVRLAVGVESVSDVAEDIERALG